MTEGDIHSACCLLIAAPSFPNTAAYQTRGLRLVARLCSEGG